MKRDLSNHANLRKFGRVDCSEIACKCSYSIRFSRLSRFPRKFKIERECIVAVDREIDGAQLSSMSRRDREQGERGSSGERPGRHLPAARDSGAARW